MQVHPAFSSQESLMSYMSLIDVALVPELESATYALVTVAEVGLALQST